MTKRIILLLMFASFANPSLSKPAVAHDAMSARELKSMAGTWRPVSIENNGYKASEAELKGTVWIRDAEGNWSMRRGDKAVVWWAARKIDATKQPRTVDIEITAGDYKGTVYLGIYDLDGDTLRICFALPDKPVRPTEFSAHKGSMRACSTFKRD